MKLNVLLGLGFAFILLACAEKEPAAPEESTSDEAQVTEVPEAEPAISVDQSFLAHMHKHAEKLDEINFSLADGDLEGSRTPAYWLSRHETVDGLEPELQEFVYAMRIAAEAVEAAPDLDTAQVAAEKISAQCTGCHSAAGVDGA